MWNFTILVFPPRDYTPVEDNVSAMLCFLSVSTLNTTPLMKQLNSLLISWIINN